MVTDDGISYVPFLFGKQQIIDCVSLLNRTPIIKAKCGFDQSTIICSNNEHSLKGFDSIDVTDDGIAILLSDLQLEKASRSIDVTDAGIVIRVSEMQQ